MSGFRRGCVRLCCAVWMGLVVAACGGGGEDRDDGESASAVIGPAGGSVVTASGAKVIVPPGALAAPIAIAIERTDAGSPALPQGFMAAGAVYAFTPHGTVFAAPVTVSIPVDLSTFPAGLTPPYYKTNAAGAWERVPGATLSGSILSVLVTSFSGHVAGVPPHITRQPEDATVNVGGSAAFTVAALGAPPFAYQWQRSSDAGATWDDIVGATSRTHSTAAAVAADNGTRYRAFASNPDGASTSQSATLTVTVPIVAPAITTQPASVAVGVGDAATFSVSATGTVPIYRWQISRNGGTSFNDVSGASNASFSHANAQLADNGAIYRVVVGNSAGSVTSANAVLSVTAAPPPPPPPAAAVARLAAGSDFSLAVDAAGVPHSWGSDQTAALGNGPQSGNFSMATPLGTISGVRTVSAGSAGVAVKADGTVWAFGYSGYIDCNAGGAASTPVQMGGAANIVAASSAGGHTLLLDSAGAVFSFGCNDQGQLGRPIGSVPFGSPAARVIGLPVAAASRVIAIAAAGQYSLALTLDGEVWAWGQAGVRGDGADPFAAPRDTPLRIAGLSGVTAIAAGEHHALALLGDRSVRAWGLNDQGQLGDGTTVSHWSPAPTLLANAITAIAAGGDTSLAVRDDGVVLSWGSNSYGQLGTGAGPSVFRAAPAPVVGLTQAVTVTISRGLAHALALRSDGSVWSWGSNFYGQLGDGTRTHRSTPVPVTGLNLN